VFYSITPLVAQSDEEARLRAEERRIVAEKQLEQRLVTLSKISNIDFFTIDIDAPVGQLTTNGHQRRLTELLKKAEIEHCARPSLISRARGCRLSSSDRRIVSPD